MTQSQIFIAAHKLAKTFEGNYSACLSLALSQIYSDMKNVKEVIIQNASWGGNENEVNFSIKGKSERYTVIVGAENWEEENIQNCKNIIEKELNIVISNELFID